MKRITLAIVAVALLFAFTTPLMAQGMPIPSQFLGTKWWSVKWGWTCECPTGNPSNCNCLETAPADGDCFYTWLQGLGTYIGEDDDYMYFKVYEYNENYYVQTQGNAYMVLDLEMVLGYDENCD